MRKIIVVVLLAGAAFACKSSQTDASFFDEVSALSKEEILARGDALAADKKWEDSRRYYSFLADAFPNDPVGRQAAIKTADSFFSQGTIESLTEAQLRFRDFSNRYPNDPNRPYALLMLGKCSMKQAKGPLRDLTPVREAAASFKAVVEQFPESPFTAEARDLLAQCNETLAEHELLIARYYLNVHALEGARMRVEYLLENFPGTAAAGRATALREQIDAAKRLSEPPSAPAESVTWGDGTPRR